MSKKQRLPKWQFTAKSEFLTISEMVFTQRRLNHLCKMAISEKNRRTKDSPAHQYTASLVVNISPFSSNPVQQIAAEAVCYAQ